MRNLIEYARGEDDPNYEKLTSLLHWKPDSAEITQAGLDEIYASLFGLRVAHPDASAIVVDFIHEEANKCLTAVQGINLENKVVLSIAIRLAAEKYMAEKINDPDAISGIYENQTPNLLSKYKRIHGMDHNSVDVIQRVLLMTPENIHLNSFMYEPILDMSDEHLRKLYRDVLALG